jgi:hypothetical protein
MRLITRSASGVAVACLLCVLIGAATAQAALPWWHFSSASRPTYLKGGALTDEVQELTVNASGGEFAIFELKAVEREGLFNPKGEPNYAVFSYNAEAKALEEGLERIFPSHTVKVSGGPGGHAPYIISLPGQFLPRLTVNGEFPAGIGGKELVGEVNVTKVSNGRPDGQIIVTAVNLGDANADPAVAPIKLTDKLPAGLEAVGMEAFVDSVVLEQRNFPVECSVESLSCEFSGKNSNGAVNIPPYEQIQLRILVRVKGDAKSGEVNEAEISGGGAKPVGASEPLVVSESPVPFGVNTYEMRPEEADGSIDTQAGSHPFQLTTAVDLNETFMNKEFDGNDNFVGKPVGLAKDFQFKLPPGLIGNPTPFPQCPLALFLRSKCPPQTAIGVARVTVAVPGGIEFGDVIPFAEPLYNIEPSVGEPARFGFVVDEEVPVLLDTSVRTGGDYGVTVSVTNITQTAEFINSEVTFWGVPGDPRHDKARGASCISRAHAEAVSDGLETTEKLPCSSPAESHPPPLLALPTSCPRDPVTGAPEAMKTSMEADSWADPSDVLSFPSTQPLPALDGCNRLQFEPSISVSPDGQATSTPTGLSVRVHVPQDVSLDSQGLAEADVKDTTVALPAGVAIDPAGADGLLACSEEQIALHSPGPASCPAASKIGLVKIKTPLLPNELNGQAYLAAQDANPFGSLVAIYVVAQEPVSGTLVKLAGEVTPDPVTGQLISTFKNTPQLPFETFELHFFGGDRAPLGTPTLCGAYTTDASIEPWTETGAVGSSSRFDIITGPNGTPCHAPLPFNPSLTVGSLNIQAGAFTPFTTTMSREDGEQNLQGIVLHMPPGVSGLLSGVALCGEAQANAGTCGTESQIGETVVSVGLGGDPFSVTGGKVYITGPYKGAPFGLSIVNPAKAGPYDLGQVVVRAKIEVNPITAALTVATDDSGQYKIPSIIDGIPLQIKHVYVNINRPGFTFNPTNCDPLRITGQLQSTEGASQTLSVPFQVTNCAVLGFKPGFKVSTAGKTSRANGASLNVKLLYPKARFGSQANIKSVKVDLPKQLPSRLTTLQKACTAAQFEANPAGCPQDSIVGHATAITPLIPVPLTGPAYFVSYGGAKFPELVIVLQGYGVTLDLHGETFINKAGITSSTFHTVPDAPVGSFELNLPQGKYSALAANGNLCKSKLTMPTLFDAQNGMVIKQSTPISVTGCPKAKKAAKKAKHNKAKRKK